MEKNYTSYLHRQPIFFQTIAKIKTTYKKSPKQRNCFSLNYSRRNGPITRITSDLCGGLQLVLTFLTGQLSLGNLLLLPHDLRSHVGKLTLKYLQFTRCSWT